MLAFGSPGSDLTCHVTAGVQCAEPAEVAKLCWRGFRIDWLRPSPSLGTTTEIRSLFTHFASVNSVGDASSRNSALSSAPKNISRWAVQMLDSLSTFIRTTSGNRLRGLGSSSTFCFSLAFLSDRPATWSSCHVQHCALARAGWNQASTHTAPMQQDTHFR